LILLLEISRKYCVRGELIKAAHFCQNKHTA
jgi:hypothetical protein